MTDLYTRKAPFTTVKQDLDAVMFHMHRYQNGAIDALAKQCFQYWQQLKTNPEYAKYLVKKEGQ